MIKSIFKLLFRIEILHIFLAFLFFAFISHNGNYWRSIWWDKWFFVCGSCLVFISSIFYRKYGIIYCLLFLVVSMSALYAFAYREAYDNNTLILLGVERKDLMVSMMAIGKVASYTLCSFLLLNFCFLFFRAKDVTRFESLMAFFCILDSLLVLFQFFTEPVATHRGGFLGNPSMNGCFIAFTYPFLCFQHRQKLSIPHLTSTFKKFFLCIVPVAAIIMSDASIPIGVFAAVFSAFILCYFKRIKYGIFSFLFLFLVGITFLYFQTDPSNPIFFTSGRIGIWKQVLGWFVVHGNLIFGEGSGVSQILIPLIQKSQMPVDLKIDWVQWWLWMHSDWLQLFFENGVVGFLLGAILYAQALTRSYKKSPYLFSAVVGVGVTATANFPVHFPIHAICAFAILSFALSKEEIKWNI